MKFCRRLFLVYCTFRSVMVLRVFLVKYVSPVSTFILFILCVCEYLLILALFVKTSLFSFELPFLFFVQFQCGSLGRYWLSSNIRISLTLLFLKFQIFIFQIIIILIIFMLTALDLCCSLLTFVLYFSVVQAHEPVLLLSRGSKARRLGCPRMCRTLIPRAAFLPASLALQGRFLNTRLPGKTLNMSP